MTEELSRREQHYREEKLASEVERRVLSQMSEYLDHIRRRTSFMPYVAYAAIVAAMIAVGLVFVQTSGLQSQLNDFQSRLDGLTSEMRELRSTTAK